MRSRVVIPVAAATVKTLTAVCLSAVFALSTMEVKGHGDLAERRLCAFGHGGEGAR